MLSEYLLRWTQDPDGGGCFTRQRDLILSHSIACASLGHAWLPRKGGVTGLGDLTGCDTCDITFFWEGIVGLFDDCPESFWYFCHCCAKKATSCPCGGDCLRDPNNHSSGKPGGAR